MRRTWACLGFLALAVAGLLFLFSPSRPAQASHLCGATGSPYGPFALETWEARDWRNTYARTLELAGFNALFPELPGFATPPLETGPRSSGSGVRRDPYEPPTLLKSIAWLESSWAQASNYDPVVDYGQVGPALISHDCGYGIMQVTTGMQNISSIPSTEQAMIGGHYAFNVARGSQILADKWNAAPEYRPIVGSRDPTIIENWYYAVWGYNGFVFQNHPLNPNFPASRLPYSCNLNDDFGHDRSRYPYQELVLGCVTRPPVPGGSQLWNPVEVHLPDLSNPTYAGPLSLASWNACSSSLNCAGMDMPTPNPNHSDMNSLAFDRAQVLGSPTLALSTKSLGLVAVPGGQSAPATITVSNTGTGLLTWKLTPSAPWLKISRIEGVSLGADLGVNTSTFSVWADTASLYPGTNTAQVVVESLYASQSPVTITVSVRTADGALMAGDDGKVHVLMGGLRRSIPDTQTFEAMRYSWGSVVKVPDNWLSTVPAGSPLPSVIADGRLVQGMGQSRIYAMEKGAKRPISNVEAFNKCGYGWDSVLILQAKTVDALPSGATLSGQPCPRPSFGDGKLLQDPDGDRWVSIGGYRKLVAGDAAFEDCGYRQAEVDPLPTGVMAQIPTGSPVTGCSRDGTLVAPGDSKIYRITGGLMRHIPDAITFEASGMNWGKIVPIAPGRLPSGNPLLSLIGAGRLIKDEAQPAIYVIDSEKKRPISGPDVFKACGYEWKDITVLPSAAATTIPQGAPLQAAPCPQPQFPTGTLLQGHDGRIWVTLAAARKWITNWSDFSACGYQPGNIDAAPDSFLLPLKEEDIVKDCKAEGSLITNGDGKVYTVRGGRKRLIPNDATFEANHFARTAITPVPDNLLAAGKPLLDVIATGRLVKSPTGATIYAMDSGKKRPIANPTAFSACGYDWYSVTILSGSTIASLPAGQVINGQPCPKASFPDGTLFAASDTKLWVAHSQKRDLIPNLTVFRACGYNQGDLNIVPDGVFAGLPIGSNVIGPPCP